MKAKKCNLLNREAARLCNGGNFWLIIGANKIGNKIHCAASKVDKTWWKYSLTMDYYVEVQHLDETAATRP